MNTALSHFKDPSRKLKTAYLIALSVIALLALCGNFLVDRVTDKQKNRALTEISYETGNQRISIFRIALNATNYELTRNENFRIAGLQENQNLAAQQEKIKSLLGSGKDIKPRLYKLMMEPPYNILERAREFHDNAELYFSKDPEISQADRQLALQQITEMAAGEFQDDLDSLRKDYQSTSLKGLSRLAYAQNLLIWVILFIILLEAIFIFRPLVKHVGAHFAELSDLALRDPLTGANNRRAFMDYADREVAMSERFNTPISILVADLDHFKQINDLYGHAGGDQVLRHFVEVSKSVLRLQDVIGRTGGEEFAFILPQTDMDQGQLTAERLRKRIEETPCAYTSTEGRVVNINYTVSIGIGVNKDRRIGTDNLLIQADKALYKAKEKGRNRVEIYSAKEDLLENSEEKLKI